MTDRPLRHLCPEADMRDAMSDAEFWEHVLHAGAPDWDRYEVDGPGADDGLVDTPCPECHATGACGFDQEGRPMIHVIEDDA